MTSELSILQDLFLPLLEEMAANLPGWNSELKKDRFWPEFNRALIGSPGEVYGYLTDRGFIEPGKHSVQLNTLKAEYLSTLAQHYCAGQINFTIAALVDIRDPAFIDEVAFQRDLSAAAVLAGRAAIRSELKLMDEFAGEDITDEEIAGAIRAIHTDTTRQELRKQLEQYQSEQPVVTKPEKRKKRLGAIPLLFLRLAAAAAVGTVVTVSVVKIHNARNRQEGPGANYHPTADSTQPAPAPDADKTTKLPDTSKLQNGAIPYGRDSTHARALPAILLRGSAVDTATRQLIRDVEITLVNDDGAKQTVHTRDGRFRLRLPLNHDYVITGKKDGYLSARLSLSTKDVNDKDAGEVIDVVLRFSRNQ